MWDPSTSQQMTRPMDEGRPSSKVESEQTRWKSLCQIRFEIVCQRFDLACPKMGCVKDK
jgi:hypothetical protein